MSGKEESEIVKLMRNVQIFFKLDQKALQDVAKLGREVVAEAGKTIVKEYDRDDTFYLILSGQVEVRKKDKVLAKLGIGQFFGEMAFFDELPTERSADVVATEQTKCLAISGWGWIDFLKRNPDVAIEVIRSLATRLRAANEAAPYY